MHLARVIGSVWATRRDVNLSGGALRLLQPVTPSLRAVGQPIVALDTVGAGPGEIVFFVTAYEAVIPWKEMNPGLPFAATDASIVGIVDSGGIAERSP